MNPTSKHPMKRVRTKTYSITLYLVLLAVGLQFGVIFWNFWVRSQVIIDTQAPELPATAEVENSTLPTPPTPVIPQEKSTKPTPLGTTPSTILSSQERSQSLLSEAKRFLEQGETSLARNALLEVEKVQPDNIEALTQLALIAEKIQNKELALDYWSKVKQRAPQDGEAIILAQQKIESLHNANTVPSEIAKTSSPSETPEEKSPNLVPVLPPPNPVTAASGEQRVKRMMVGTSEKKFLQSSTSKTEFLLKIPIIATPSPQAVEPGKVSIKLYFYEQQTDGKVIPSTARLDVSFENKRPAWNRNTEILNALYSLPNSQTNRNYFGYRMRIYYKGQFQDEISEPEDLNDKYPMAY